MSRNYSLYLQDAVTAIDRIASYVEGVDLGAFETDQMRLDAVIRNLQIIGEAVKKIPDSIEKKYPNIPWREIGGLRNRVTHVYFDVDTSIIWDVVHSELPILRNQIQEIIEEIND